MPRGFRTKEFLEEINAEDTTPRVLGKKDVLIVHCFECKVNKSDPLSAVALNTRLKKLGHAWRCKGCLSEHYSNLRRIEDKENHVSTYKNSLRTTELLKLCGAVDTTERPIQNTKKIEFRCVECQGETKKVILSSVIHRVTHLGYGWRCKSCFTKAIGEKASLRTGEKNSFFGKKHTEENVQKIINRNKRFQSQIPVEVRKSNLRKAAEAFQNKYGVNNPMDLATVRKKHHESTHTEKFINRARELGAKQAEDEGFSERMGKYSDKAWAEGDGRQQRRILLRQLCQMINNDKELTEKRKTKFHAFHQDKQKVKKAKQKAVKTSIRRFGSENWNTSEAGRKYFLENFHKYLASAGELELCNWVRSLGFSVCKHRCGSFEIDIFIPELKIGIEFNGLYWHSEIFKKNNFHFSKTEYFEKKGIRLIHVFEHEWAKRSKQVENFLRSLLGKNSVRVGARKCQFTSINMEKAKEFCEREHIQGFKTSEIALGCFYQNELVAVATFSRHHRNRDQVVLNRFCAKSGMTISGALSKFSKMGSAYYQCDIISWADLRYSTGEGYSAAGWELEARLPPDYFYLRGIRTYSKQTRSKKNTDCPSEMTEKEFNRKKGFLRIYDCGKLRFVYRVERKTQLAKVETMSRA